MAEDFDLAVVGGGAAALWTTLLAAEQGARTLLVTAGPIGSHASTRAQGWLHSGGFYAAFNAWALAKDCAEGSADIRALARRTPALTAPGPALFLARDDQHAAQIVRRWATARIEHRPCPNDWDHPGFALADSALDMQLMLRVLAGRCLRAGAFIAHTAVIGPPRPDAGRWMIDTSVGRFACEQLVLGLGAGLRDYLRTWRLGVPVPDYRATRTNVLVLPDLSLTSAVIPLYDTGPTLLPIWHNRDHHGVTACLPLDNVDDYPHGAGSPAAELLGQCADRLPELGPRLTYTVRRSMWTYTCQKLLLAHQSGGSEAARTYRHDVLAENLTAIYAGKLTCASVAARSLLATLPLSRNSVSRAPGVALQPLSFASRAAYTPHPHSHSSVEQER